ncbi:MAG: hypothetical protein KDC76_13370, partial [Bacteroidetes bacterium]|nr:hypothetical protein [Bacteroidota bacterium]
MKRFCSKCFWILLIVTPVILCTYILGSKWVKHYVVEELNDQLQVRIDVHSIHLNGFSSFPHIGLKAWNIEISESQPHFGKPMLKAGELVAEFNPLKLLKGENVLDRIQLRNGTVRIFMDSLGGGNFEVFKPNPESTDNEAFNLNLRKVELVNFRCIYFDQSNGQSTNFFTDELTFSGKFSDEKFDLKVKGTCLFDHLAYESQSYITGKHANIDLKMEVDRTINSYHIERGNLKLDALELDVQGDVLMVEDTPDFDLTFEGRNMDLQSLLSLLPNDVRYPYRDIQSNGKIALSGVLNGRVSESDRPQFKLLFKLNDVGIFWPERNLDIRSVQMTGNIQNAGKNEAMSLQVSLKEFRTATTKLSGLLDVADLDKPNYKYECKGVINLHDFEGLLAEEESQIKLFGTTLLNIQGSLPCDEQGEPKLEDARVKGDIEIKDLVYTGSQQAGIDHLFANGRIYNDDIQNLSAKGQIFGKQTSFEGKINNWQSFMMKKNRLKVHGKIISAGIDLDQLIASTSSSEPTETSDEVDLDIGMDLDLKVTTDAFKWGNLKTEKLMGDFIWNGRRMVLRDARFNAWDGSTDVSMVIAPVSTGYTLNALAKVRDVSIRTLMTEFKNFDQEEFTAENLSGSLTSDFDLQMYFDHGFNAISDSIRCIADMSITNGRLTDYKPLESLSSFVKLEDLMQVEFERLENSLDIRNGTMYIPDMEIRNSAMNLSIGGSHSFENYMDYRMRIKVT